MSLEINGNDLEKYRRRNNLEITWMSHGIEDKNVKQNVIQVLTEIQAIVSNSNIETFHFIGESRSSSKKTTAYLLNKNYALT